MSSIEFQERLQRIGENSRHQSGVADPIHTPGKPRSRNGQLILGAFLFAVGLQSLRFANQNYEQLADAYGSGAATGIGLAAVVVFLLSLIVLMRAIFRSLRPARAAYVVAPETGSYHQAPRSGASGRAKMICSLLGLIFGFGAAMYLLLSASASLVDTETARHFAAGGVIIACVLALTSLIFGLIGIFVRGYALGRVTVYFILGFAITYAAVRILRVNPLNWEQFAVLLQG